MARFVIGIDLGTTNSALAYVDLQAKGKTAGKPQTFAVPQLVAAGQVAAQPLLPSFLYRPGPHDLPEGATALPWDAMAHDVVGQFARTHGAKIAGRLVSSAKSWLCHPGVDRTAPLLPWAAPPEVERLSPLAVSAKYLRHMVEAWNAAPGRKSEDRLEECPVTLTVPASFDDMARSLTAQAAVQAGLKFVTLLEEPQAAFYCWLGMPGAEAGQLKPGMRCVVVDVGGGTSDFSLIRAEEEHGHLAFLRDAVGDHLLLGGDNMDLALAKMVEAKLTQKLDAGQFGTLVQACRGAKETVLGPNPPAESTVSIMGKGRSVIAGTISAVVNQAEVRTALFDGFFPQVDYSAEPATAGAGLQEMGLPYVADAAVTRHLAAFLRRHLPDGQAPDAILFNGGVFQPQALRDRIVEVMKPWFGALWKPTVLTTPSLDLAVAWGAAYSGWLKETGGRRIGGGTARSYYIQIETAMVGDPAFLCVVPRRMQEGDEIAIPKPELELALGEPVLFPLFTSTARPDDRPGDVLNLKPEQLLQLPPLHTVLRGGKRAGAKRIPVTLAARSTEIGTLELSCVSREGNRWKLEFNTRDTVAAKPSDDAPHAAPTFVDVFPEEKTQAAAQKIREAYSTGPATPQELTKQLEAALESGRVEWPTGLCRRLWEPLAEVAELRTKSPAHLQRWYNLAGFVLRPGFGDPLDRYRVEALWKTITATASGAISGGNKLVVPEGGADYWILWRRVAGGLNGALQQALFARLKIVLLPSKTKPPMKPSANELTEMWRAAASLERLDAKTKESLGDALAAQVKRDPVPNYVYWSLTRLGGRALLYGPLNTIVHPNIAERWLAALIERNPRTENDGLAWAFCIAQLARKSGLRGVDISGVHADAVAQLLRTLPFAKAQDWAKLVEEVVAPQADDTAKLFGDALPIGLRLPSGL